MCVAIVGKSYNFMSLEVIALFSVVVCVSAELEIPHTYYILRTVFWWDINAVFEDRNSWVIHVERSSKIRSINLFSNE